MALKKELRDTPFFRALHRALSFSTYATLFELLPTSAQVIIDYFRWSTEVDGLKQRRFACVKIIAKF